MLRKSVILVLVSIFISCGGVRLNRHIRINEICNGKKAIIDKGPEFRFNFIHDLKKMKRGNYIILWFNDGFNKDTVKVYFDGQLKFDKELTSNLSSGSTEQHVVYNYGRDKDRLLIKITLNGNKDCLTFTMNKKALKFKIIRIYRYDDKWIISPTNFYSYFE